MKDFDQLKQLMVSYKKSAEGELMTDTDKSSLKTPLRTRRSSFCGKKNPVDRDVFSKATVYYMPVRKVTHLIISISSRFIKIQMSQPT